jgi:hypothetical protein
MTPESTNVAEFIQIRQQIESLANQIGLSVQQKEMPRSKNKFDEAVQLLEKLAAMANNDVQDIAVARLTRQLAAFGIKVEALVAKKRVVKKAVAPLKTPIAT